MASTPSASTPDHGFYRRTGRNCVRKPYSRRSPAWRRYIRWAWSSQKTSRLGRGYPDRGGTRPQKSARARSELLGWPCRDAREPIRPSPRRLGRRPELGCHDLRNSSCWVQRVRNAPCPCFESRDSETIQHTLFGSAPPPEDAAATRHVIRHPRRRRPQLSSSRAAYCGPARRLHDDRAGRMHL